MSQDIPPNQQALIEALELSGVILKNIELSEISLSNIALKASRLARLLNDFDFQKIMEYEVGGYPMGTEGVAPDIWKLARLANRIYQEKDVTSKVKEYAYLESIGHLEEEISSVKISLEAARDPNVSLSSSNPHDFLTAPKGNQLERIALRSLLNKVSKRLSERKVFIYNYCLRKHYELKFSGVASDNFSRIRKRVDSSIGDLIPSAVQKFSAIYENLISDNPEDWSNAVHSCRRILQDLADVIFPASDKDRIIIENGVKKRIKLGPDNYINRIICFVEDHKKSDRFADLVGSHLKFLGDRLDAIFKAGQKGSHETITSREEADRYVVYTYLIVGDILTLKQPLGNDK